MLKRLIMRTRLTYRQSETQEERTELPIQTGALPCRHKKKGIEVLLVTGRRSRRWTIPKGWPMPGKFREDPYGFPNTPTARRGKDFRRLPFP